MNGNGLDGEKIKEILKISERFANNKRQKDRVSFFLSYFYIFLFDSVPLILLPSL